MQRGCQELEGGDEVVQTQSTLERKFRSGGKEKVPGVRARVAKEGGAFNREAKDKGLS